MLSEQQTALRTGAQRLIHAMISVVARRSLDQSLPGAHASPDLVARAVQVVAWLMSRPGGATFDELHERFERSRADLHDVLAHLAARHQVKRSGQRYAATPERTWQAQA